MDELVSIVVAVYNNREDLDRCVQSILNQTYTNIELILVSDKPTDGSEEICRKYAASDRRIKLICHKQNQGVAGAWRSGVQAATGKYFGFVDADDYIDSDLYQKLMNCKANFDLVVCHWWREEEDNTREAHDILASGPYTTKEDMDFLLEHLMNISILGGREHIQPGIFPFQGPKLFKTALIKSVFNEMKENPPVAIDMILLCRYMLKCQSVLLSDICGYHYQIRNNSVSHFMSIEKATTDSQVLYNALKPLFMDHPNCKILLSKLQRKIAIRLNRAPVRMGFPPEAQNKTLVFPFINQLEGKHIVLCGAGMVGQDYRRQIRRLHMCEVDLWVDKQWEYHRREGLEVSPVRELTQRDYDYAVIAVFHRELAEEIKKELLALGVKEEKILWKAPFVF